MTASPKETTSGEVVEIITRTSTIFNQPRVSINGAGKDCQISVRQSLGDGQGFGPETVVFTGKDFSREKFEKQGGVESEKSAYLDPAPPEKLVRPAQVVAAETLARYVHRYQRYGDHSYTRHLEHVCRMLTLFGFTEEGDPDLHAAGWLHDAQEDQACPFALVEQECGAEVAELVRCVTNGPGKNRHERHTNTYPKLRANRRAVILKLADRIANVVCSIKGGGRKLIMYRKEYRRFKEALCLPDEPETALMWAELDNLLGGQPQIHQKMI